MRRASSFYRSPSCRLAAAGLVLLLFGATSGFAQLRPPSVPLVVVDPYFSIWSAADHLTDTPTKHWTGRPHRLTSFVRIDGKAWRVMGDQPASVPAMKQKGVEVKPTRTIYTFESPAVEVTLTFTTPALPDDLTILARPVTYVTWDAKSADGLAHTVSVYFDATAEPAVNEVSQEVVWSMPASAPLLIMNAGTKAQPVLQKKGDDLRIDWGYFYVAAPTSPTTQATIAAMPAARTAWLTRGIAAPAAIPPKPISVSADDAPVMAVAMNFGRVEKETVSRWLMLAYDDLFSVQYFGKNLRPYWRRTGMGALELLAASARDYDALRARCAAFDEELATDLVQVGGERYAAMAALAYRQTLAGNKLAVDANGQPLLFPKENTSNGCIGTVDVIYPMAPQFLFFNPSLAKAMLVPVLDYASSPRWRFPFAPHDLGTYPKANGQVYGGGEKTEENQMPVEESANLLILVGALARVEGRPDFAAHYWPVLAKWAEYLKAKGFDPENQLCTDDFAGHLAHNVNLSAKAIVALGAYAQLAAKLRDRRPELAAAAEEYATLARQLAGRWVREADDGDHFRLAFDRQGSWSQKYNLVWDAILGLNLFPEDVLRKEMAFYRRALNRFGLPLDNRKDYAKIDWTVWTATLTGSRDDFEALVGPAYDYLYLTPDRVPVNDLYWTSAGREVGMHARPVVGAFFLPAMKDGALAAKWTARDTTKAAAWAAFPDAKYVPPPVVDTVTPVVATADVQGAQWIYTTTEPVGRWYATLFKAGTGWKQGWSGFGTPTTPGSAVRTIWNTGDIWLRREVSIPAGTDLKRLYLVVHHDDEVEIYINGVLAAKEEGHLTKYEPIAILPAARGVLRAGRNLVAVHCHQAGGGQFVDVGLATVTFRQ
jgi:hypothetical protein